MEQNLPLAWGEAWDNIGLLVGNKRNDVTKVSVALDASRAIIQKSLDNDCDLLLTHHPIIFNPIKQITTGTSIADNLINAIQSNLAIYAAHTNWDVAPNGVNRCLSDKIGLLEPAPIMPPHNGSWGLGCIGDLPVAMEVEAFFAIVCQAWGLSNLSYRGEPCKKVKRIALCGGSGADLWGLALSLGADVFITADVKYHHFLDATSAGILLAAVDHGEMERATMASLAQSVTRWTGVEAVLLDEGDDRIHIVTSPA